MTFYIYSGRRDGLKFRPVEPSPFISPTKPWRHVGNAPLPGDYVYEAPDEELAAARLLHERGWYITEPTCPACYGHGRIPYKRDGIWRFADGDRCPNGCWTADETSDAVWAAK